MVTIKVVALENSRTMTEEEICAFLKENWDIPYSVLLPLKPYCALKYFPDKDTACEAALSLYLDSSELAVADRESRLFFVTSLEDGHVAIMDMGYFGANEGIFSVRGLSATPSKKGKVAYQHSDLVLIHRKNMPDPSLDFSGMRLSELILRFVSVHDFLTVFDGVSSDEQNALIHLMLQCFSSSSEAELHVITEGLRKIAVGVISSKKKPCKGYESCISEAHMFNEFNNELAYFVGFYGAQQKNPLFVAFASYIRSRSFFFSN